MPKADLYILDTETLEAARRARLLTLSELQKRAGIGVKTLWMARTGRAVGLGTAKAIARALRVPARSLVREPVESRTRSSACA
ncbi:MAG: helix-turn-helix transcriptional regulator [Gemmatimonadota bacterium]|nr:MAG: helix-turn-helix transcriptional regulator [Gemmatimonadota bacterium]